MFPTTMKKLVITAAIAAPLALSLSAVVPSGDALAGCEKIRGTIYCETSDRMGNSDVFKNEETSKKGSDSSSHDKVTDKSMDNGSGNHKR
jgi:hypothetical protein